MTDLRAEKRALRRRILAARDQLDRSAVQERSRAIRVQLGSLDTFVQAGTVHLFASFGTEVDTVPLLDHLWARGARTVLPRVVPGRQLEHRAIARADDLRPGFRDIPEPLGSCPLVVPAELDCILVPGVAFDDRGGRLGYGGGYYDRFLQSTSAPRIALAFALQLVDRVPREDHDLTVDRVVTEEGVLVVP